MHVDDKKFFHRNAVRVSLASGWNKRRWGHWGRLIYDRMEAFIAAQQKPLADITLSSRLQHHDHDQCLV